MSWMSVAMAVMVAAVLGICGGASGPADTRMAADVVAGFKSDNLPIANSIDYDAATDPEKLLGRPGQYVSRTNFHDDRIFSLELLGIDVQSGGAVEVFANTSDATKRLNYLNSITKIAPRLTEYDYQQGPIILRLSRTLTPDQAEEYHQSLLNGAPK